MADVFISYSRTDSTFVEDLVGYLESQERDVWLDKDDIAPADDWQQDIYNNIDDADSFVFVVSAKSLESEYCGKELVHAQKGGKRIIPIACDAADPDAAPTALAQLNWIWCREWDDRDDALGKLTSALETDLAWAKAHTRLLVRAVEWDARGDGSLLLRGADLKQAEADLAANAGKEPAPTELQQRYVLASRRAATKRQRIILVSVAVALAVSLVLGVLALLQRNNARNATQSAGALASSASASNPDTTLDLSLLLSLAGYQARQGVQERSSVISALESWGGSGLDLILHGHTGAVLGVAYSPNGRLLASSSDDGTVRLWDLRDRRPLSVLRGHGGSVNAVAFSPDGRSVASGSADGAVRLWNVANGTLLAVLRAHRGPVNAVAFSDDGRTLASGGADGTVRLWDVRERRKLGQALVGPGGAVHGVAFSRSGLLAAAAENGVRLWSAGTHRPLGKVFGYVQGYPDQSVAFDPKGRATLAAASKYGNVYKWKVLGKRVGKPESFTGHSNWVYAVAFSSDGRRIASASADGTVIIWNARSHRMLRTLRGHAGDVETVAFAPNGRTLASGGADRTVRIWDVRPPVTRDLKEPGHATSLAFDPRRSMLASGAEDGTVRLFRPDTRSLLGGALTRHDGRVNAVAFSPDGDLLASATRRGIRLWSVPTRRPKGGRFDVHERPLDLAFSPDGSTLASVSAGGVIRFWNVRTRTQRGEPFHGVTGYVYPVYGLAFSPDGRMLASAGDGNTIRLWNARTHHQIAQLRGDTDAVVDVAFSPDGKTLASASWDGTVRLWDIAKRREVGVPLRGHAGAVYGVVFSPDGQTLASIGDDATVRLWDVQTGRQLGQPLRRAADYHVAPLAFSPDGRTLAFGTTNGQDVELWQGVLWRDLADLRSRVCSLVVGNLSPVEVQEYASGLPNKPTCPD